MSRFPQSQEAIGAGSAFLLMSSIKILINNLTLNYFKHVRRNIQEIDIFTLWLQSKQQSPLRSNTLSNVSIRRNELNWMNFSCVSWKLNQLVKLLCQFYLLILFSEGCPNILFNILLMKKPNQEVHNYIVKHVNPFIEPLVYQLAIKRPADPLNYAITWLTEYEKRQKYRSRTVINSDTEDECMDEVKDLNDKFEAKKHNHKRRICISEEAFGQFNDRSEIHLNEGNELTNEQKELVKQFIRGNILFQNLDSKDEEVIIKAVAVRQAEEYEVIIKEGQAGNHFYIVSTGQYDCYKCIEDQNIFIKTYGEAESFGQLALLYNAPRAATIVTRTSGRLLVLQRSIFSQILKVAALRKQTIIKQAIEKVELLQSIPTEQRYGLIQILKEEKFEEGAYVIRQGESGDKFYVVMEGNLVAEKQAGEQPMVVMKYSQGSYFGQLALLNNEPRQASVRAVTNVKLACVSRQGFKRVFGPLQQALKLKSSKYHE